MKKIVINVANLHAGGGVQVASSFLFELSKLVRDTREQLEITVMCSQKVYNNLPSDFYENVFNHFEILNIHGLSLLSRKVKEKFSGFDVCFTVFGPIYFKPDVKFHICGFAQPWIAYPDNYAYSQLSLKEYLKNKLKFTIQSQLFKRYDHLVVEQQHVSDALCKLGYTQKNISVVSNCVSSIYEDTNRWVPLEADDNFFNEKITLGFIGRAYPHKNVSVLSKVNEILISKYKMKCNFIFTFTESEMNSCGFSNHSNFHTVGEISATQCPSFYQMLDALVFPSLLECFSASPIEAMKMKTTVIASDYPFVKEVCGEAAFYFDPLSADKIATSIYNAFSNNELRENKKLLGLELVSSLPTASDRASAYLDIIKSYI